LTEACDVAIVGSGPTGSSCALEIARRSPELAARTIVLEKARHPREKYCAGAVSAWGLSELERLGVDLAVPHVPIRGVRVRFGTEASVAHGERLGVVVRRAELDAHLAAEARRRVGELREETRVLRIARDGGRFRIETTRGELSARVVVAADGSGSIVRKALGFPEPRRKAHLYVLETAPGAGETDDGVLTFDLSCLEERVLGYYWDFPTVIDGVPAVSRGIYHLNPRPTPPGGEPVALREVLRGFLARRGWDLDALRLKAFSERGWSTTGEIARPGVVLAGEAAGVDPVSGEGIAQALVLGGVAARAVVDGFARGDVSFSDYARAARGSFAGRHLGQAARIVGHVYGPSAAFWARFLVREPLAMQTGLRWYRGERLGLATKARLAARLLAAAASRRGVAVAGPAA